VQVRPDVSTRLYKRNARLWDTSYRLPLNPELNYGSLFSLIDGAYPILYEYVVVEMFLSIIPVLGLH